MTALTVKNLTKVYPSFTLNGVSFSVEEGRIAGLVGRNGAGKSTALKAIMRLISSTGEISVFGKSGEEGKEFIGYAGGGFRYYPYKTLASVKRAAAGFYPNWNDEKYKFYLKRFALDERKRMKELSEGMKVKFALTLAASHGAKLLILDEPTSGLDPLSREEFCDIVLALVKNEGVTVLFSTHITSDVMRIADDVIYLSDGKVLKASPLSALLEEYSVGKFSTEEEARRAGAIGIKEVKSGFEGLLKAGARAGDERATLDQIIIHLERENL